jgi:methionyl-tRNA formyltransferase
MTLNDLAPINQLTNKPINIVFMGTPEFAVPSLDKLLQAGYNIVAVVTAPDKAAGRGLTLQQSAIKKYAVEKGLKVLQPEKLRSPEFIDELRSLKADLQVVVAFRMLPEVVWNMPSMGTINLHASLLPQYRGAAPINWAIINGEKETGATTFKLKHEIDTGNILLQEKINIGDEETAGELHDRMKEIGGDLLVKTINGIVDGSVKEISQESIGNRQQVIGNRQDTGGLKHAQKLTTETSRIDWNKTVDEINNLIRGLSPYPAAFTSLNNKTLKIFKAEKEKAAPSIPPREYVTDKRSFLKFACTDGYISVKELQLEGKKRMNIADFLRGYKF